MNNEHKTGIFGKERIRADEGSKGIRHNKQGRHAQADKQANLSSAEPKR